MRFVPIRCDVPNMRTWGASRRNLTFVISQDDEAGGEIRASVKVAGATPFDGGRHDLGVFPSFIAAVRACEKFEPS